MDATTAATLKADIVAAHAALADEGTEGYVQLVEIRSSLSHYGWDRPEVDEALAALLTAGEIYLEPEVNRHRLTDSDRRAAIKVGGEYRNLLLVK